MLCKINEMENRNLTYIVLPFRCFNELELLVVKGSRSSRKTSVV